jgi:PAS domain S-box-containing protein
MTRAAPATRAPEPAVEAGLEQQPAAVLKRAVEEAARLLGVDGAMIYLYDPDSGMLRFARDAGIRDRAARRLIRDLTLPMGVGMFGTAAARRELTVTSDYPNDPSFNHSPVADQIVETAGMRAMAVAPMQADGKPLGALGVFLNRAEPFKPAQLGLLTALANHAAATIANERLVKTLARQVEAQRTLGEIATQITALRDPGEVLQGVVDAAHRLLGSDGAHLTVLDASGKCLRPVVLAGGTGAATRRWLETQLFPVGGGMNGLAAARGEAVCTDDYLADPRIPHEADDDRVAKRMGLRGMAVAPLRAPGGEVIGTLAISYRRPRLIGDDELDLLGRLADQGAIALANATLVNQLHASERRHRFLVESSPDVVFETDVNGLFRTISDAIQPIAGWQPSELIGKHFSTLVTPETLPAVMAEWEALVADPSSERRVDFRMPHKDGGSVPVEVRGAAVMADGKFAGVHGATRDISERVRLEEELRQKAVELERSEERYRFLVESSPDIVFELDADGRFTFLSTTSQTMTGWDPAQVLGQGLLTVVSPATADYVATEWQRIQDDPTYERPLDFELATPDGRAIPVEARGVAMVRDGKFAGVHGSVRDVSERIRLENDLRRRVEVQRAVSEIAQQLTAMRDPAAVLQRTLDEAARLLHADGGEMDLVDSAGRGLRLAYTYARPDDPPPPDSPDFSEPDQGMAGRALTEGRVVLTNDYLNEPSFNHTPEADAWVRASGINSVLAAPLIGESGPLGAILIDARRKDAWDADDADILGALANQAAVAVTNARLYAQLESSERRYRHLVENSPDTIWSADVNGTITYLSETIEHLSGWRPEELVGKHFSTLVHPSSGERLTEAWAEVVDERQPERVTRFYLRHRDGHAIPAETTGIPEIVDGRTVGAHGAVRDISARERLEADLRDQAAELAASQERASLARELHDSVTQALFSMGLTASSLELLLDSNPDGVRSKLAELRELQKEALAEMRTLIFELRPKNLEQDGLEQALRTHAASVQGRTGLSITVEADRGLPTLLPGDAAEALYRIAQEALHNVVKHASASTARILLTRAGGKLKLSVTDDGVGFDPKNTPRGQIGLVGMQQRAEQIGGTFAVSSRPGSGTAVSVTWPLPPNGSDGPARVP